MLMLLLTLDAHVHVPAEGIDQGQLSPPEPVRIVADDFTKVLEEI
jgi:hypothetical protein